jgi:sodium-coupled neutral amino acid transporter 11
MKNVFGTLPRLAIVICICLCSVDFISAETNSKSSFTLRDSVLPRRGNERAHAKVGVNKKTTLTRNGLNIVASADHESHGHKMSLSTLIINIVADLCPHGMLPLAYGLAQGGPTGIIPAVLLVAIFGSMSAYTMTVFAKLAEETKSNSISEVWGKLISEKSRWIADAAVFSLCFGCCVFYSAFMGDIFGALSSAAGITGVLGKRWVVLGAISSLCLLPLCLLEDISSLQFSSVLGVVGIMFTFLFHAIRVSDKTYTPGSGLFSNMLSAKMQPKWPSPKYSLWNVNKGTLVLVNMLCVAFLAHYNAINYYKELDGATEQKYKVAIVAGFGTALTVFIGMMLLGYSLFGSTAQPLILNNFHVTKDILATVARFATGLAITFAYPLMFAGLKSSMFSLIELNTAVSSTNVQTKGIKSTVATVQNSVKTASIITVLGLITSIAFKCGEEDVSLVLGIVGSVLGCGVAYIIPGELHFACAYMHIQTRISCINMNAYMLHTCRNF